MQYITTFDINTLPDIETVRKRKTSKCAYINAPFAFDIETTSYIDNDGNKRAFMYEFSMSLNGVPVYGRYWYEFMSVLRQLKQRYKLSKKKRLVIYVHNLAYEFQFLQGRFPVSDVFARVNRHPMKCVIDECFEFRCSYVLSGLSLAKTAEQITIHDIKKLTGDLDYKLIRTRKTPLTEQELAYCENDVQIIYWFIKQEMLQNGNSIANIPLTKTGYVRRYCYEYISTHTNFEQYRTFIKHCAPTEPELFILMHKCFAGGFTHANVLHVGETCENVGAIDFTSSYPAQMVRHKYPMTKFYKVPVNNRKQFETLVNTKACLIEICFKGVNAKTPNHIISSSKCQYVENGVYDNGRIVSADKVYTYITDVDYNDICQFYDIDKIHVVQMWVANYGYLPNEFLQCVLTFFADKTTLKGVKGKEQEYLLKKGMLNSAYGMSVTNPVNNECEFVENTEDIGGVWQEVEQDINGALLDSYIGNNKQFLLYQWGVWVTAWARHELFQGVLKMGIDVIYCDTDSIKYLHPEKYKTWVDEYNERVFNDMLKRCDDIGVSRDMVNPVTITGEHTPLGVFDYEKTYKYFKTLGAKRYAFSYNGDDFSITVSGLNKKTAVPYIMEYCENHNISPFDFFDDDMYIPAVYTDSNGVVQYPTGKSTLSYSNIGDDFTDKITDYLGETDVVDENSYIHMTEQDYSLSLTDAFLEYISNSQYVDGAQECPKPDYLKILKI